MPASANTQNDLIKASPGRAVATSEQVRAELLAWAPEGVEPGKPVWLGLQLAHQPEWHTYWKNSGDSGLPTTLEWQLPAGVTAGEIAWPTPTQNPHRHAGQLRLRRHGAAARAAHRRARLQRCVSST